MSGPAGEREIMLFGVRVQVIDPMRKSVSMNNLSEYQPLLLNNNPDTITTKAEDCTAAGGYASADDAVPLPSTGSRDRKRGVPWTEEEHKQFLIGLHKVGKGDWRGISRNYVKTRTPTQVASHAQKYFLRRTNVNRRRRRSSLFDITTDSVTAMPTEEECRERAVKPTMPSQGVAPNMNGFSVVPFPVLLSMQAGNPTVLGPSDHVRGSSPMLVMPVPVLPVTTSSSAMMMDFNLNRQVPTQQFPLSLSLSLSSGRDQSSTPLMPSFKNEDTLLTVV